MWESVSVSSLFFVLHILLLLDHRLFPNLISTLRFTNEVLTKDIFLLFIYFQVIILYARHFTIGKSTITIVDNVAKLC